jgi:RNase P/RNase MRP subunit p29
MLEEDLLQIYKLRMKLRCGVIKESNKFEIGMNTTVVAMTKEYVLYAKGKLRTVSSQAKEIHIRVLIY